MRDDLSVFTDADVQVVAVSCDPMYTLRAWGEQERYDFPLLSDFWPHGEVARRYGAFDERGGQGDARLVPRGLRRGPALVGRQPPRYARDMAAYREALATL